MRWFVIKSPLEVPEVRRARSKRGKSNPHLNVHGFEPQSGHCVHGFQALPSHIQTKNKNRTFEALKLDFVSVIIVYLFTEQKPNDESNKRSEESNWWVTSQLVFDPWTPLRQGCLWWRVDRPSGTFKYDCVQVSKDRWFHYRALCMSWLAVMIKQIPTLWNSRSFSNQTIF